MRQPHKHNLLKLLAVCLLLWAVYLWGAWKRDPDAHAREVNPQATSHSAATDRPSEPSPARAKPARTGMTMPALRAADLIADVHIDKSRVCAGESFLVNIRGKPENAGSQLPIAELNFNIDGRFGNEIALTPRSPGIEQYTVVASNGVDKIEHRTFNVEVLPSDAQECTAHAIVTLAVEHASSSPDLIVARVVAHQGLVEPIQYTWSFGDGIGAETREPVATHDYALRDQQRTLSSYVVSVDARDANARHAQGRATIHLMNNHYRARMFGSRLVQAVYDHFPAVTSSGYHVDVTLRSFEPDPVVWEHAKLVERRCLAGQSDQTHELAAAEVTTALRLEPERASKAALQIPKALVGENTCAIALELTGDTIPPRSGHTLPSSPIEIRPVMTRINLEIRAAPSAEQGGATTLARRAVRDPELLKKLRRAAEILGSERITPAQLERLERDGKL